MNDQAIRTLRQYSSSALDELRPSPDLEEWADASRQAIALIENLTAAIEPFAEVAAWAERNGHDLGDFDMLLRGPGTAIAGHLQAQSDDFIRAAEVLRNTPRTGNWGAP